MHFLKYVFWIIFYPKKVRTAALIFEKKKKKLVCPIIVMWSKRKKTNKEEMIQLTLIIVSMSIFFNLFFLSDNWTFYSTQD